MRKKSLVFISMVLLLSILLTACGISIQLPAQVSGLLDTAKNAAQPAAPAQAAAPTPSTPPLNADVSGLLEAYQQTLTSLYEQVNPSVVNISVLVPQQGISLNNGQLPDLPFNFPGLPGDNQNQTPQLPQYGQALGSGFVWDKEGHIVTNNHVVSGAEKIQVTFADGTIVDAKLVGADHDSDLAVIKVDVPADQLQPVQLADSDQVKVGQIAIAIGNPFGLENTMTVGIVSAVGRTLPASDGITTGPVYSIPDIIQTDAPINPGNSGGVLVDAYGRVIGVTAAIESPVRANAGIGFVIPSNIVKRVVPALIKDGSYAHPYLGISGTSLTPDLAKAMNLEAGTRGALVIEVNPGTPAEKAGLRGSQKQVEINGQTVQVGGDVIIAADGQPIKSMDDLIAYLSNNTEVGQKVSLTVLRDGKETQVNVTLEARPTSTAPSETAQRGNPQDNQNPRPSIGGVWLGILGQTLTPDIAQAMDLQADQTGVLVQQVVPDSPAGKAGLQGSEKQVEINGQQVRVGGDVITALNGEKVNSIEGLVAALQQYQAGDKVSLTILRNGSQQEVSVTLAARPSSN